MNRKGKGLNSLLNYFIGIAVEVLAALAICLLAFLIIALLVRL